MGIMVINVFLLGTIGHKLELLQCGVKEEHPISIRKGADCDRMLLTIAKVVLFPSYQGNSKHACLLKGNQ